jgi:hypothetical protein
VAPTWPPSTRSPARAPDGPRGRSSRASVSAAAWLPCSATVGWRLGASRPGGAGAQSQETTVPHDPLDLQNVLRDELEQRRVSGYDISGVESEVGRALETGSSSAVLRALWRVEQTKRRAGWRYREPSTWEEIHGQLPPSPDLPRPRLDRWGLRDRLSAARLGRAAGQRLGTPTRLEPPADPARLRRRAGTPTATAPPSARCLAPCTAARRCPPRCCRRSAAGSAAWWWEPAPCGGRARGSDLRIGAGRPAARAWAGGRLGYDTR